ncbi:MAG TPA: hypothetical protein VMV40_02250 [Acidiferrobacter sp.]|nr:hypothetical protein [Acidiferrobacter sp.]
MIMALPASLARLAPRARHVLLRPYTALGAVLIPNLGLRLIFPRADAGALTFALTNPFFKATRVGAAGILITVPGAPHGRYCSNLFIGLRWRAISLLVCTTTATGHYASDIVFVAPPPAAPEPSAPIAKAPPAWAQALADIAFGGNPEEDIKIRVRLPRAGQSDSVYVSRFVLTPTHAVLGFAISGPKGDAISVSRALLYRGRSDWRRVGGVLACDSNDAAHETRCALVVARPDVAVSRWHLVIVTSFGTTRVSW